MLFTSLALSIQDKHACLLSAFSKEQNLGTLDFKGQKAALKGGSRKQSMH